MVDLAPGMEARNYGLKKAPNSRNLWESLKILFPFMMIAGALSFYIWLYSETLLIGYQTQQFNEEKDDALQIQQQLILEEQTLISPERLDLIARSDLGMVPLKANQLIILPAMDQDAGSPNALALGIPFRLPDSSNTPALN
jgi:cell division protein FtsL